MAEWAVRCGLIADLLSWLRSHSGNCIRAVNIRDASARAIKFNHLKTNSRKSTNYAWLQNRDDNGVPADWRNVLIVSDCFAGTIMWSSSHICPSTGHLILGIFSKQKLTQTPPRSHYNNNQTMAMAKQ